MHRSGTSAVTRLFNLLGADLPAGLMRPSRDNKTGFWEADDLRNINDEILASGGSSWQDWRAFDPSWYASPQAATLKRRLLELLHRDFGTSSLFVLEDPRICRILPIWLDALAEFGARPAVVISIRNPIEVAESFQQRDGIAPATTYLSWLRHVLDAERGTRDVPRVVTTYDELLRDWYCLAGTVGARTDVTWPTPADAVREEVDEFLAARLRHHAATRTQLAGQADLVDWVKNAYAMMTRIAQVGEDETSLARLDRIGDAFDMACRAFGDVVGSDAASATSAEQGQTEHAGQNDDVERLNDDIVKLREDLDRRSAELEALSAELGILRALSDKRRGSAALPGFPGGRHSANLTGAKEFLDRTISGLGQYLRFKGAREAQADAIRKSGLFDDEWYLNRYPDVASAGLDPLPHYLEFGSWEGRDPHPLFDQVWYRTTYPDVVRQKLTPLGHFVTIGAARGYDPNPLFHTAWYVANNRDVTTEQVNPLRHYVEHAAEEGRNPNPLFDSAWYLKDNPDVAEAGVNPLAHYIHHGIGDLRDPHPLFDTEWYLDQYEHVVVSGMDALEHYLTVGAFEGFRPQPTTHEGGKRRRARIRREFTKERSDNRLARRRESPGLEDAAPHLRPDSIDINRWQMVLRRKPPAAPAFTGQVGVFVHLFYDDLAEEIAAGLLNIPFDFKLYVSTNTVQKKEAIEATFQEFGIAPVVKVLPNRGWDIAPFLLGFAEEMRSHDICLKLHGKQSRHGFQSERGNAWRKHLLSGLLGHPANVGYIVDSFSAHPELGVVMIPHWRGVSRHVNVIGVNYAHMQGLLQRIGFSIAPDLPIEFPSGSMFWFRRSALEPLFDLGLGWPDFNRCRPRDLDATIAHGIERCILMFAAKAGFKWAFLPRRWMQRSWIAQKGWGSLRALSRSGKSARGPVRGRRLRK